MQNLIEFCKAHKLFAWDEIPSKYKNEHNERRRDRFHKDTPNPIPDELANMPNVETGVFWRCTEYSNECSIEENPEILAMRDGVVMRLGGNGYRSKGKYHFHLPYFLLNKYNCLSNYERQKAVKGLESPNTIGVWTEKKVADWFGYVSQYQTAMEDALNKVNEGNAEIEKQIAAFIASMPGAKVSTWQNRTIIETRLFYISFEHHKDQAHLSKKIEFKGTLGDVSLIGNI